MHSHNLSPGVGPSLTYLPALDDGKPLPLVLKTSSSETCAGHFGGKELCKSINPDEAA